MKKENKTFIHAIDAPYFLHKGIQMNLTNSLGYNPINNENIEVKTNEDLIRYLGKMDCTVLENHVHLANLKNFNLMYSLVESEEKFNKFYNWTDEAFGKILEKF